MIKVEFASEALETHERRKLVPPYDVLNAKLTEPFYNGTGALVLAHW